MPFTLAHVASVVPLGRLQQPLLVSAALVIGCMVPDLAYFIPQLTYFADSHSLLGLLLFCLPFGIVTYFCFYLLVAPFFTTLCSASLQRRLPQLWRAGKQPDASAFGIVLSILLGAATHLLWDAFTHDHGFIVVMFDVLATPLFTLGGYTVYIYKVLQHGSTIVGLGLLLYWGKQWFNNTANSQPVDVQETLSRRQRIVLIAGLFVPPTMIGLYQGVIAINTSEATVTQLQRFVGRAIISSGTAFIVWLLLCGIAWRVYLVRSRLK